MLRDGKDDNTEDSQEQQLGANYKLQIPNHKLPITNSNLHAPMGCLLKNV